MATSPEAVRAELAVVTTAAATELTAVAAQAPLEQQVAAMMEALGLVVPAYYDAAGALAVAWYDEIRDESSPTTLYTPQIVGEPATDWIEREVAAIRRELDADLETEMRRMTDELAVLASKEVARGFRDSITGNAEQDEDALGWSRVAHAGACKFCRMLADKGAYFRSESTATFSAHGNCHCAARPEFRNGEHGPEASVLQYLAAEKQRSPKQRIRLREHLNENYPDAPG